MFDHAHRLGSAAGQTRLLEHLEQRQALAACHDRDLRKVFRNGIALKTRLEVGKRLFCCTRAMEACDQLLRQHHLDVARIAPVLDRALQCCDFRAGAEGQQVVIAPHQDVRHRHGLAEDLLGRLGNADVVAQ